MVLKDLVVEKTHGGDDWYSEEYGSTFDRMFPRPPLHIFVRTTEKVLLLHLTGATEEDVESLYLKFRQNDNPAFEDDYRAAWTAVVDTSQALSWDGRLESVDPFKGNLRFYGDLRVFLHNRCAFFAGPKGGVAIPMDSLGPDHEGSDGVAGDIMGRTGSTHVRIALPWVHEIVPGSRATPAETASGIYDVFLSHKSQDFELAKQIYDYFTHIGKKVFLSEVSLPALGNADYTKKIDEALDGSKHLILVGSSIENITSSWVEAEWRVFINEKRSGRKNGNILTVYSGDLTYDRLPISLRYYEAMPFEPEAFDRIGDYLT